MRSHPVLLLVSAPSGAGKTTLCKRLLAAKAELRYSISTTTRPPRAGEQNGVDYHFTDRNQFEQLIKEGAFLEYAEVHGNLYGTCRKNVQDFLKQGLSVLMDVDVQGAGLIRDRLMHRHDYPLLSRAFVDVFIRPPSLIALRERLEGRAMDDPTVIEHRLQNAKGELEVAGQYAYQIINDDLETAADDLFAIYRAATLRTPQTDA